MPKSPRCLLPGELPRVQVADDPEGRCQDPHDGAGEPVHPRLPESPLGGQRRGVAEQLRGIEEPAGLLLLPDASRAATG